VAKWSPNSFAQINPRKQNKSPYNYNHSAASSKNLSNSNSSWKQSISSLDNTGDTEMGFISSMLGIILEDKEVQGSGWRASLGDEDRIGAGVYSSCVAPVIFTAGMILKVTNPKKGFHHEYDTVIETLMESKEQSESGMLQATQC